ncbi:MAG: transglycosylase domain-containing protein [Actinobacteria bacterium]|nr:transglycosylase domain-containing protein [Actinomycetota bacterium]MCL6094708.1 transglycosylase domain-containing protein [Actinomycetota bacterium]
MSSTSAISKGGYQHLGAEPTAPRVPSLWRVLVVLVALVVAAGVAGTAYVASLPSVSGARSRVIGMLRDHHDPVGHLPLPSRLARAMVAAEDSHFWSNYAIDMGWGIGQAFYHLLRHPNEDPGGSTIDQQVAKLLYHPSQQGWGATLADIGLGIKLDLAYPREQILEMYMNAAYYGNHLYGYEAAAEGYFCKAPSQLTWGQASMLAGIIQAPALYDPFVHLSLARQVEKYVLGRLVSVGALTAQEALADWQAPLGLHACSPSSILPT